MANWTNRGGIWINQPQILMLKVVTDDNVNFYIGFSSDGVNWALDESNVFASEAAAQSALNTYAATLG